MPEFSIVFTGSKETDITNAIEVLSDVSVTDAEKGAIDQALSTSQPRGIGLEHGQVKLGDDAERIHLYGTCSVERGLSGKLGQIIENGLGLIMLIDNSLPRPFEDMRFYLQEFSDFVNQTAMVIGITRMEQKQEPKIEDYQRELWACGFKAPILEIDTRNRRDPVLLMRSLLYSLDPGLGR